jgi:4'-phosphopantetheinyl transferase
VIAARDLDGVVQVWRISLATSPAGSRALLSADERERASRFQFARDRERFVTAHAALRRVLAEPAGCAPERLVFGYTAHDKPFLIGPGADLSFNLSHSHELALVAVTRGRAIGVDVEHHRAGVELESVARTSFSAAERRALLALPPHEREAAFFRGWTRKEAYLKARGEGLSMPLDRFSVSLDANEDVRFEPDEPDERGRWEIRSLAIDPGYSAALSVSAPCPPIVVMARIWDSRTA